jgi:hypothetical protein
MVKKHVGNIHGRIVGVPYSLCSMVLYISKTLRSDNPQRSENFVENSQTEHPM